MKESHTCSGNPFEEGTPFQRIRYRKLETHGCESQALAEGNPPVGKPLVGDNHSP